MGKLFVANVPFRTTEQELETLFQNYGVKKVTLISDRDTGRPKGFGFVECDDSQVAISDLHGQDFNGRDLVVKEATEQKPRS